MIKENFICPCCGLPNHLEFQSKKDYNEVREQEATGVVGNINTIFDKYLVGNGDDRTSTSKTKLQLQARLEKIQQFSNRFDGLTFQEWFDNNVVCFILNDDIQPEDYLMHILMAFNADKKTTVLNENLIIEKKQIIMNNNLVINKKISIPLPNNIKSILIPQSTGIPADVEEWCKRRSTTYEIEDIVIHYEVQEVDDNG